MSHQKSKKSTELEDKMKKEVLAMRLRDRLQEISIAENINAYCHRFAMQKKCTAYTKSQKKPFCCKINQNNIHDFHSIHQMVILQPNEIPARSLNTFESETRLNNVFFTYLFLFPFFLFILLHFLNYCKRGGLMLIEFMLAK